MRTWRVGSMSMGVSLLLLGVLLLISQFFQVKVSTFFLTWWPVILIVLGLEILIYLLLAKEKNPIIKYDFLSIVFVSLIGMFALTMTVLVTTGIAERANDWMQLKEKTLNLPDYELILGKNIKRLVVDTGNHDVTIENIASNDITIFGSYQALTSSENDLVNTSEEYVQMHEKGDTLYLKLKNLPNQYSPFPEKIHVSTTILVPKNIQLEVDGSYSELTLKPRQDETNWIISNISNVNLLLDEQIDLAVHATDIQNLPDPLPKGAEHTITDDGTSQSISFGDGENSLSIHHVQALSINSK